MSVLVLRLTLPLTGLAHSGSDPPSHLQGRVDVLAFIPDQAQAGADDKSAADGRFSG